MISDGDQEASTALPVALVQWKKRLQAIACLLLKSDMDPPHLRALETDDNEIFWLYCHNFQTPGDLEAAELFALLAHVDYALWKEFLRDIWPDEVSWIAFFEGCASLRVGVELVVYDDERDVCEFCDNVVDALHTKRSANYKHTRALLERVMGASLPVVPLQLACNVHDDSRGDRDDGREEGGSDSEEDHDSDSDVYGRVRLSRLLSDLHDILARQPRDDKRGLRVSHFALKATFITIDHRVVAGLASIRDLQICVAELPTVCLGVRGQGLKDPLRSIRSLLDARTDAREVLAATYETRSVRRSARGPLVPSVHRCALKALGANLCSSESEESRLVPSVLSAIQASRSLRSIFLDFAASRPAVPSGSGHVDQDEARRFRVWWMAYALFWRRPLTTVDLVADQLSVKDVEWMEQVWRAANPLTLVFPDEVDTGGPRVVVASRVFLSHPGRGTSRTSSIETSPCAFDVIGKSQDGYLTVLLPGWGKAWVQEAKAKIVSNTQLRPAIPQSPTYLLIRRPTSVASVLALLHLVGPNLKYLGVRDIYCPSSIGLFEHIVSECPNLEALELPGMTSLQPLLDAFRARKCVKLQRLELKYVTLVDESEVIRVFDALANQRDAIATTLRQLDFDMRNTASRATFDAVLGMLTTNARLREVDFMFNCNRALAEEFEPRFAPLHLSFATEPLPPRCILAFLSAARAGAHRSVPSRSWEALERCDSGVMSLVLAFAATRVHRSVAIHCL